MRAWLVLLSLTTAVGADPVGPPRWQQASDAPALTRMWGAGAEVYGVGASGVYRSTDGGASWMAVGDRSAAVGVWGTGPDDVWVVRSRSVHHSTDGAGVHWTPRTLPLSFGTQLEGMWGTETGLYVFGADRSSQVGVILHSRDGGASWQREPVEIARVAAMWGRASNEIYAVGSGGSVLHSTGNGAWKTVRTGSGSLEAIWGTSGKVYAVGTGGTITVFDGKTWTTRSSGVTYTLSSIDGANGELFAGSADGAPLKSTDGATWKPITALVPRGLVWSSGERIVVASTEVHYFGETSPSTPLHDPIPLELRPLFAKYAKYPALTELLQHTAHHIDPSYREPSERFPRVPGLPGLDARLAAELTVARTADTRLEAHARYVRDGGALPGSRLEIATGLNKPPSWDGFFWNFQFKPRAPNRANCEPVVVARHEQTGDAAMAVGRYQDALVAFREAYPCRPPAMAKAYLAACKAHDYGDAKTLFLAIGRDSLAMICIKEGFDPRVQP